MPGPKAQAEIMQATSLPYRKYELTWRYVPALVCSSLLNDLAVWRSTMSDTYRRSAARKRALMQFFAPLSGHHERHVNTLVALICGLAGGRWAPLSTIAAP